MGYVYTSTSTTGKRPKTSHSSHQNQPSVASQTPKKHVPSSKVQDDEALAQEQPVSTLFAVADIVVDFVLALIRRHNLLYQALATRRAPTILGWTTTTTTKQTRKKMNNKTNLEAAAVSCNIICSGGNHAVRSLPAYLRYSQSFPSP